MQTIQEILQSAGVLVGGLLARLGLFLAALLLLALPALLVALVLRAVSSRRSRALGLRRVAGLLFRPDVYYGPGHTWLRPRGVQAAVPMAGDGGAAGGATKAPGPPAASIAALEIGIDDLVQRLLPSVTAVELRRAGTLVARGDPIATLYGGGRSVQIVAPVAGTVAGVNAAVLRDPSLVKRDGYARGWLVAMSPSDWSFADLPRGARAESWLQGESVRWSRFVEHHLGFAAADGGELLAPAPWLIGEEGWRELTSAFLRG
jgi:glycine cleavage system H protein